MQFEISKRYYKHSPLFMSSVWLNTQVSSRRFLQKSIWKPAPLMNMVTCNASRQSSCKLSAPKSEVTRAAVTNASLKQRIASTSSDTNTRSLSLLTLHSFALGSYAKGTICSFEVTWKINSNEVINFSLIILGMALRSMPDNNGLYSGVQSWNCE